MKTTEDLSAEDLDWLSTPVGFCEGFLGMNLYPKQKEALRSFGKKGCAVSFASANGGGKTKFVAAGAILWHLFMWPKGVFAATSGSYRQVESQLMPALWTYRKKFPNWTFYDSPFISTEEDGFFQAFSTDKPGTAEGFHGEGPDKPLSFLVDEAKSAQPWLRGVVEGRIRPDRLLLMSSHGYAENWFYESQTTDAKHYQVICQRAEDCPHITPEEIQSVRQRWGKTGLAQAILGHGFLPLVEDAVVDYKEIDANLGNPPKPEYGERHMFCDFAWSSDGDETVVYSRNGNKLNLESAFREEGLHPLCDRLVYEFKRTGFSAHEISGDEGGGGQLVMDELDRRGWRLQRWNNGAAAKDAEHFQDCKAECWYNFSELLNMRKIILPDDPETRIQLINRKRVKGSKGRLAIETKRDMKERGVASPDRADALIGCCMPSGGGWSTGDVQFMRPIQMGTWEPIGA